MGSPEDVLGALVRYRLGIETAPTEEPILNVTSAKLRSLKSQRFATKKRDLYGFDLA
jgi:hypothetical protein